MNYRINDQGYTWLKMDLGIGELKGKPGTLVNDKFWQNEQGNLQQWGDQSNYMSYGNTLHPFTQIQITDKGLDELAKLVENVRGMLGYDIPLSTDHYGHFDLNNGIRLGKSNGKIPACLAGRYYFMGIYRSMENDVGCIGNTLPYR